MEDPAGRLIQIEAFARSEMQIVGGTPEVRDLAWSCARAFVTAVVLTPILRDIFRVYGVVDRPGKRKVHKYPIPRLGGISVAAAYFLGLAGLHTGGLGPVILPGAGVIFVTGILDDFFNLLPGFKLAGQVLAGYVAYYCGLRIPVTSPLVGFPLTVFWLVLSINAFNLVDGLDGLCAGLGCTAACALLGMGVMQHNAALIAATPILAGGLAGFLCHNFGRATMFLGDSGALLIGFLVGCCGLLWSSGTGLNIDMVAPVLVVWVPVLDLGLSILRRRLAGRPIFSADKAHIHHRLLERGLNTRQAVLILYACGVLSSAFALAFGAPVLRKWQMLIVVLFLAVSLAGIRELRYSELRWRRG